MSIRSSLALSVKVMTTDETPWPDVLVMLSMFCSPATASSIGRVIWTSTSFGLAPGQTVVTTTTGTLNLGNRLMGSAKNDATPAMAMATKIAMTANGFATDVRVSHIMGTLYRARAPVFEHRPHCLSYVCVAEFRLGRHHPIGRGAQPGLQDRG